MGIRKSFENTVRLDTVRRMVVGAAGTPDSGSFPFGRLPIEL